MRRLVREPVSVVVASSLVLAFLAHPGTNVDLLLWRHTGALDALIGSITYAWSHLGWQHVAVNAGAIVLFGQLLGRSASRAVATAVLAGVIAGALGFQLAVAAGRAGVALQGASAAALAVAALAAVELRGWSRLLAIAPMALATYPFVVGGTWFSHVAGCLAGLAIAAERRLVSQPRAVSPRHLPLTERSIR